MLNANLGINVEIIQPERGDMIDGLWAHDRWQFFLFGWTADSPSASVWTYELLVCGLDSNFSTYCNEEVDALVDTARTATNFEEAKADLEKERSQLQRTRKANRSVIAALQDKAEGYEELLKAKDKEIDKLKDLIDSFFVSFKQIIDFQCPETFFSPWLGLHSFN